jgi:hypothetical protein
MLEEPFVSQEAALQYITALIKNYEPQFEFQGNFTLGVFGRSDPQYRAIIREWRHDLVRKGFMKKEILSLEEVWDDLMDDVGVKDEQADSRLNWRVTTQHAHYLIHIMALDKTFQRFAFALQTKGDFEQSIGSYSARPFHYRYEAVNRLSELKPILDDLYEDFKRREEERRQQDRIDKAVAEEREKWVERLAKERENRRLIVYFVMFIAVLFVGGFVVNAVNEHFDGVPGNVLLTALGAGIIALIGTSLFLWGVVSVGLKLGFLKDGKPAPILLSACIVFFALWAALAYATFTGLI